MRGLQEKRNAGVKYLGIKHNAISEESKHQREGFVPVESKGRNDELVIKFFKFYDRVEAIVTKIEFSEREWEGTTYRSWRVALDADGTQCVLELPFESRVSTRFMKLAENIDFTRPVEFAAWRDKDSKTAFFVGQRVDETDDKAVSVPQKYTVDSPGDCPGPKQRLGSKWDFSDQVDFLYERMVTVVIPKLEAVVAMTRGGNNGHGAPSPLEDDDFVSTTPPPTVPDRDALTKSIAQTCKQLNEAGDSLKWTSGKKGSLYEFINKTYEVEDGLDSLTPTYLLELQRVLNKRLTDLEDLPF